MAVIINRAGLGDRSVYEYCHSEHLPILAEIPFDRRLAKAYSRGRVVADALPEMKQVFIDLAARLREWAPVESVQKEALDA
jgi:MinD superfamily P-loop ATPase